MNIRNNICEKHHFSFIKVCLADDCPNLNIFCSLCHKDEELNHAHHKEHLVDYDKFYEKIASKFEKIFLDK